MSQVHRSSMSQISRSTSQFLNYIDELSDNDLIKQVNDLKYQIKVLTLENEIVERTIMRLEPSLMHGVLQAIEYANRIQSVGSLGGGSFIKSQTSRFGLDSLQSPSRMFSSPSKISTRKVDSQGRISGTVVFGSGPRVNVLERSELVATEVEILIRALEKTRSKAAKKHALLKAQLEELGLRVADIKSAAVIFNQSVIVDGWDSIAQRIPAEIWIRYMTEWVKIADTQIGKLRLRTSTLNTQYSKFKGQIRVKEELSESLRPVDFEKLKIENAECLEIIEKKFQQLGELKKMTGDANLNLAVHKKAMMVQNNYLSNVLNMISNKNHQVVDLDKEREVIQVQADSLANRLEEVKKVRIRYEVPDIMDYVQVKAEMAELKHCIKMLENRSHIQQIALNSLNKKLHEMV